MPRPHAHVDRARRRVQEGSPIQIHVHALVPPPVCVRGRHLQDPLVEHVPRNGELGGAGVASPFEHERLPIGEARHAARSAAHGHHGAPRDVDYDRIGCRRHAVGRPVRGRRPEAVAGVAVPGDGVPRHRQFTRRPVGPFIAGDIRRRHSDVVRASGERAGEGRPGQRPGAVGVVDRRVGLPFQSDTHRGRRVIDGTGDRGPGVGRRLWIDVDGRRDAVERECERRGCSGYVPFEVPLSNGDRIFPLEGIECRPPQNPAILGVLDGGARLYSRDPKGGIVRDPIGAAHSRVMEQRD